ncbi:MAG: FeoB small GTPase domain-containing protein [Thermosulfidibacteraceae bacterium]|jgi:ferrous iron transport protein B
MNNVVEVVGTPNTGKKTLVNTIAETRLKGGNWLRVTVEKKTAIININGLRVYLGDLSGVSNLHLYSIYSIYVADATNREKSLYFLIGTLEIGLPVIVALNMYDEAKN